MALTADFISYFLCWNIKCCPQYFSLCHHSLLGTQKWKCSDKAEGRLCIFLLELLQLLLYQQTTWQHLQTLGTHPLFKKKQVRPLFKQELCCWLNLWDPEETDMLKPCIFVCYIMLMSSAERKGSLPVHAIQLLCSAFFPFVRFAVNYLSLL